MQPPEQRLWVNVSDLKGRIVRKIGAERSKQYFDYLNKFLSLKLSKVEFDKLCVSTVGRDGISLHNQLIRTILRNACTKKVLDGVYHQNGSGPIVTHGSSQIGIPNGDVLLTSPRKARTGGRERKGGDRKSALGPNGKTGYSSPSSSIPHSEDFSNGNSPSPDTRRPVQHHHHHHQELMLHTQNADGRAASSAQKARNGVINRISLHAPLGIPYYPVSVGGSRRGPPAKSVGVSDTNYLLDTITLRARMEPIVATQGLQGVSVDSANALNIGLNAYLKGIIRSCSELTRPVKTGTDQFKLINNAIPGHQYQTQEYETKRSISLQDLRFAMELNPQQLGEDAPILIERICTHAFEE